MTCLVKAPRFVGAFFCLFFFLPLVSFALDWTPSDIFTQREKQNLRIRENGVYRGYLYNESRTVFSVNPDEAGYTGVFFEYEQMTRDARDIARRIDSSQKGSLLPGPGGVFSVPPGQEWPFLLNFPAFPEETPAPGERWRGEGLRILQPVRDMVPTRVPFLCEFEYAGPGDLNGEPVEVINAQYAVRYRQGADPWGDPNLTQVQGKHLVTIYLNQQSGKIFMRDTVDEVYDFSGGRQLVVSGFILTWYGGGLPGERKRLTEEIREELERTGTGGVTVEETGIGVSINLEVIHFVPDQAVVLPEEKGKIDTLAAILRRLEDKTFLVVGHTADVGTPESQMELSIQRAKTLADELAARGIPAGRFLYEGRGGTEPVAPNDTEEGRGRNRRVQIFILED
ncbi:MAG: OmpA family protein [Spirochaetales bacterium]|nr:OmpA family protein [Spirochaetales bacterium]